METTYIRDRSHITLASLSEHGRLLRVRVTLKGQDNMGKRIAQWSCEECQGVGSDTFRYVQFTWDDDFHVYPGDTSPEYAMRLLGDFLAAHGDGDGDAFGHTESLSRELAELIHDQLGEQDGICRRCENALDTDCFGAERCPVCDEPCPGCHDGGAS